MDERYFIGLKSPLLELSSGIYEFVLDDPPVPGCVVIWDDGEGWPARRIGRVLDLAPTHLRVLDQDSITQWLILSQVEGVVIERAEVDVNADLLRHDGGAFRYGAIQDLDRSDGSTP